MYISYNWLKQYINLPDSIKADEVARNLTMSTVEVESVHHKGKHLENIVVGKVLLVEKHPNADKLKVCEVDVGTDKLKIVCGGSNVREGMLCAVAKLGAKVKWHGEGESIEMKEAEIRGVKSYGMICASTEIGLGEMFPLKEEKEILDLSAMKLAVGKPLAEALSLNEVVLEIDNKSMTNRPDLWGHYGMAREVAAVFKKDLKNYEVKDVSAGSTVKIKVKVEDEKLCPRYMAVVIEGIKIEPSPAWLAQKIHAIGLRPINNIVDITNYIMYDLGEPMHAFDAARLKGIRSKDKGVNILVKRAKDGEKFRTLDGAEHQLDSSMLVIANDEKSVALAGIMGGEESEISNDTTTIIFEAANFDAATIRKASVKLGLRTDSSARFEKALDPNLCEQALAKAVELTLQLCTGAKVASKVVDDKKFHLYQGPIELPWEFLYKKIGVQIDKKEVLAILERLGFELKEKKDCLVVTIPTWRATKDISIPEDLVEEVARIYGYNNIPVQLPVFPITPPIANSQRILEWKLRDIFSQGLGYSEVYNYSFVSGKQIKNLGDDAGLYLELDNPISDERPYLRRHIVGGLIENVVQNIERFPTVKLFEIGKKFTVEAAGPRARFNGDELLPQQGNWLIAIYADKKDANPYWQMRQAAQLVADNLNLELKYQPKKKLMPWQHPTRSAELVYKDKVIGLASEITPQIAKNFGLSVRAGILGINIDQLVETGALNVSPNYQIISAFPEVMRDLAFVVKKSVTHDEIVWALHNIDHLLKKVELFDVYEGATIGDEYKSMAYRFTFSHTERTLKSEEVDKAMEKVRQVIEKLGGEVRV
ncbi:MAG: phenylalanine--tRNA ligase subunit beta [Candidatus Magasanikbacteria bacterium]